MKKLLALLLALSLSLCGLSAALAEDDDYIPDSEFSEQQLEEAKLYKALDGLEALISHNESDISTWQPNEYALQQSYAWDRVAFSPYLMALRERICQDSLEKIRQAQGDKA